MQKLENILHGRNTLVNAMGFPSNNVKEATGGEYQEALRSFDRTDLTPFNTHYSTAIAPSLSTSHTTVSAETEDWCIRIVTTAVKDTIPPDALETESLSHDTYQSLRLQQQNAGPDPHLEVSTKPRNSSSVAASYTSGTEVTVGKGNRSHAL